MHVLTRVAIEPPTKITVAQLRANVTICSATYVTCIEREVFVATQMAPIPTAQALLSIVVFAAVAASHAAAIATA